MTSANNSGAMRQVEMLATLMDSKFRIPGTQIRFGFDALLGLIPGAGDLSTFAISSYMILIMSRNGASGYLVARMVLNVLIDTVLGSVPILGDIFDIAYKSNTRNLRLMQRHYREGQYKGGAWKVIVPVTVVLLIILAGIIWLIWEMIAAIYHALF